MTFKSFLRTFRVLTLRNVNHPLGLIGLMVMYLSGIPMVVLLLLDALGFLDSPYVGIFTFLVLPAGFALGALLVALGRWRAHRRTEESDSPLYPFPRWDLNNGEDRNRFVVMIVGGTLLLIVVATLSYRGVEYTESVGFCGKTCHTVMQPEYTAYSNSPHARVSCVECHIGPGADWYVRSKLSGLRQVWAVITNSYNRPIGTPIHNLRPARETCEQCHWPQKFHGDKVLVKRHYDEDEENSELVNALVLKVGGGGKESGFATGIHWHIDLDVDYIADESREDIKWIRATRPDGSTAVFVQDGFDPPADFVETSEIRRMDCLDCHNRPTHTYEEPDVAVNEAITAGLIDKSIPYIKRETMAAIKGDYPTQEDARREIPLRMAAYYDKEMPDAGWAGKPAFQKAVQTAVDIYSRNIFPKMKVAWGTYPNHIGHEASPGCFRCHDDSHSTADGKTISQDCDTCHTLLAWEERDPEILHQLFP
ncbi:MAG: NapC/NirT family cytochrome c [Candidatus Latescibacteria bacterium]|nr:NapC/NirT family cytochrome c [Candidatus Latescibacterota bacterium]